MILNFKHFLTQLENYFFPEHCLACRKVGSLFCPACRISIKTSTPRCSFCASKSILGLICSDCHQNNNDYPIDGVFAYGIYEQIILKNALRALKFQGLRSVGLILGRMLGRKLLNQWHKYKLNHLNNELPDPIIVALPLHRRRQRERGFNQVQLIAQGVSEICGWRIDNNLRRKSYQKKKFLYSSTEDLQGQTIILIDDVFITGATSCAAALALKQAGAGMIIVAVVAQAVNN